MGTLSLSEYNRKVESIKHKLESLGPIFSSLLEVQYGWFLICSLLCLHCAYESHTMVDNMSVCVGYLGDLGVMCKSYRNSFAHNDSNKALNGILSDLQDYDRKIIGILSCQYDIFISNCIENTKNWLL